MRRLIWKIIIVWTYIYRKNSVMSFLIFDIIENFLCPSREPEGDCRRFRETSET